jgi:hypothetical protein
MEGDVQTKSGSVEYKKGKMKNEKMKIRKHLATDPSP